MAEHGPMPPAYRLAKGQMISLDDQVSEWRTPQAGDSTRGATSTRTRSQSYQDKAGRHSLVTEVANWPTPQARDWRGSGQAARQNTRPLDEVAATWRTPMVADAREKVSPTAHQTMLANQVRSLALVDFSLPDRPTPSGLRSAETRRRLNPLFVEWLMGWPAGLSGFDTAATASCLSPPPSPGCDCMTCWLMAQRMALSTLLTIAPPAQPTLL